MGFSLFVGAKSGWGKSFQGQAYLDTNMRGDRFDAVVVLDYKDEFRGLVKEGLARHYGAGPHELAGWGPSEWETLIQTNGHLVIARVSTLDDDGWQGICADIARAVRRIDLATLTAVDEAHVPVPEGEKVPKALTNLAKVGRGEQASSIWMDQRLADVSKKVVGETSAQLFGGFGEKNALNDIARAVDGYPVEIHKPTADRIPGLPEELWATAVDGDEPAPIPVRKFEDAASNTIGSEWIYSDDQGNMERRDTRGLSMQSTHYSPQGVAIEHPDY